MALALLILLTALTLALLRCRLPVQNVVAVGLLTYLIGFGFEVLVAAAGLAVTPLPSFPRGKQIANVDWTVPLLWLVLLLNWRTGIRLVVQKLRIQNGGLWVIALTSILTAVGWQFLQSPRPAAQSLTDTVLRLVGAVIIYLCIFPWLIEKKPQGESVGSGPPG